MNKLDLQDQGQGSKRHGHGDEDEPLGLQHTATTAHTTPHTTLKSGKNKTRFGSKINAPSALKSEQGGGVEEANRREVKKDRARTMWGAASLSSSLLERTGTSPKSLENETCRFSSDAECL